MKLLAPYESALYALFRIVTGLLFAQHGLQKVLGWFGPMTADAPEALKLTAGSIELVGGGLIAIGLFAGPAAFVCSAEMAVGYVIGNWLNPHANPTRSLIPLVNHGELAGLYCFVFLFIAARGSGIWSLDHLRTSSPESVRVVNADGIEELVAAARGGMSEAAQKQLAALGVPMKRGVSATFPAVLLIESVKILSSDLFPSLDANEAQRRLGNLRMHEFARKWRRRLFALIARLSSPPRALNGFARSLAKGASFLQTRFTVVGPQHYEIWVSDVAGLPGYFQGMLEGGLRLYCSEPLLTRIKSQGGSACTYELRKA